MEKWIKETYLLLRSEKSSKGIKHLHMFVKLLPIEEPQVFLLSQPAKSPFTMQGGINKWERILKGEDTNYDERP